MPQLNIIVDSLVTLICLFLTLVCIMCTYISIGELFHVHENRKKSSEVTIEHTQVKYISIDSIVTILSVNDIVEIEVILEHKIIKIGASAENKHGSSVFENKLYYIDKTEYESIYGLKDELIYLFPQEFVPVYKIDGCLP